MPLHQIYHEANDISEKAKSYIQKVGITNAHWTG